MSAPMSAWLQAFVAVSGYSESVLAAVVARSGNWERDLGIDATKRKRAIRWMPLLAAQLAHERGLADEVSIGLWVEVLGAPDLSESLRSAFAKGAGASRSETPWVLAPEDFNEDRIRAVLLEVVVQKTGYEPGLVRWEADLERDLGIDSVKQAQILGELRKRYPLEFRQGLRLRDFPTLDHWVALTQQSLAALGGADPREGAARFQGHAARVAAVAHFEVDHFSPPQGTSAEFLKSVREWRGWEVGEVPSRRREHAQKLQAALRPTSDAEVQGLWLLLGEVPVAQLSREVWQILGRVRALLLTSAERFCLVLQSEHVDSPIAAALGGALRSLQREWPQRLEWLSVSGTLAPGQADALLQSLPSGSECHLEGEVRATVRGERRIPPAPSPSRWWEPERRTLVVGGVSGIGEELAAILLQAPQAEVVLWGRRALTDPAVQKTMTRLKALAQTQRSRVTYQAVDVLNEESVSAALRDGQGSSETGATRRAFDGVVYAAGVIEDEEFRLKTEQSFHRVFETKVLGFSIILQAFQKSARPGETSPRDWAVFSSVAGRRGNEKQVDYAAANEALRAMAQGLARAEAGLCVRVFDWGAWAQVGMAARSGLARFLEEAGEPLIPISDGLRAVFSEFTAERGGPAFRELLVLPVWTSVTSNENSSVSAGGLLEKVHAGSEGGVVATASLDPARDLWLREHTILEDPLLPAVFGVEFLVEVALEAAARILHGAQGLPCEEWQFVALRELSIESGVAVLGREPLALQVEAVPVVRSATRAVFATSLSLLGGRRCYRAWVEVEALATRDEAWVGLPQSPHNERALEDFLAQTRPEALARTRRTSGSAVYARIRLGPSFQILEEAYAGEEGSALGFSPNSDALLRWPLSVAERERGGRAWASEPALLEAAFHCAAWWGLATEDRVIVPRALGALRCLRVASPGARRAFFAKARSGEARGLFDLWVFEWVAGRWETLFAVDGYETYDVSGISSWGTSNPDHSSQGKKRGGS